MELPFERQALQGEPLPRGLSGVRALTYYALCYTYKLYKNREITQQQGSSIKKQIIKSAEEVDDRINQNAIRWQNIESTAREYANNPTRDTADAFYAAVFGMPEDWRNDRNKAAIKNIPWED